MVKLGPTIMLALLASSTYATPSLRATKQPPQQKEQQQLPPPSSSRHLKDFDLDLPWGGGVHVSDDGAVSISAPGIDIDRPVDGPVSISAPGVDVVVAPTDGQDGPVSVSTPIGDIHSDEEGHVTTHGPDDGNNNDDVNIHGLGSSTHPIFPDEVSHHGGNGGGDGSGANSTNDAQCDPTNLREAKTLDTEPSCETSLPRYLKDISGKRFSKKSDRERVEVLDGLCKTKCGANYTAYLLAARALDLKCAAGVTADKAEEAPAVALYSRGKDGEDGQRKHHGDEEEEEDGGLLGILEEILGGGRKHGRHKKYHHDDDGDENTAAAGEDGKGKNGGKGDKEGDKRRPSSAGAGIKAVAPTAAASFPGLTLGCLKADDGHYCATKKAALYGEWDEDSCSFYRSCCYGSYLKGLQDVGDLVEKIEKACPGSKAFATKACKRS